ELLVERGLGGEAAGDADAGVEGEDLDGPAEALGAGDELFAALLRREVALHGLDARTERAQLHGGALELGLVGGDDEIEPAQRRLASEVVADTGGCARDERERSRESSQVGLLSLVVDGDGGDGSAA